jgi:uncharacterized protein YndB with AHSA1/START domain
MMRANSRMKGLPFRVRRAHSARWVPVAPEVRLPVAIRVEARIEASPERVFAAWLDPDVARRWLFATASRPIAQVEIDARVGGGFRFVERLAAGDVEHRGDYVAIVPHCRLVFTLVDSDRRAATSVSVEIEPDAAGCTLALTHENVPLDLADGVETRWAGMLYGLAVTLDALGSEPEPTRVPIQRHGPIRRPALAERRSA